MEYRSLDIRLPDTRCSMLNGCSYLAKTISVSFDENIKYFK
jgi:hypothetical protein